jgi:hypothetical protein
MDYLTGKQKKAVILIAEGLEDVEVADKLDISVRRVREWQKNNELFQQELNRRLEEICGVDHNYRRRRNQFIVKHLYDELTVRAAEGDLKGLSSKDLIRAIAIMQDQLRIDAPKDGGEGKNEPKKSGRNLRDLQQRFKDSNSGKLFHDERTMRGRKVTVATTKHKEDTQKT